MVAAMRNFGIVHKWSAEISAFPGKNGQAISMTVSYSLSAGCFPGINFLGIPLLISLLISIIFCR